MPRSLEEDYFEKAHEQYQQLIKTLREEETQEWEHGEIESYINKSGTELLRRLLQVRRSDSEHLDWVCRGNR